MTFILVIASITAFWLVIYTEAKYLDNKGKRVADQIFEKIFTLASQGKVHVDEELRFNVEEYQAQSVAARLKIKRGVTDAFKKYDLNGKTIVVVKFDYSKWV